MKYFLQLAYKGTRFSGWQNQSNAVGIQSVVEDCLSRLFHQQITCHACGRTDAGVHASQFFAHFVNNIEWDFDAVFRLNKMLPADIRVLAIHPVAPDANAQTDAISRTYHYRIHRTPNPFLAELSTHYPLADPYLDTMQQAIKLLPHFSDFRSFCKQPDSYPTTICQVQKANLTISDCQSQLIFSITADRFLRAMVRMIVGELVMVGMGKKPLSEFKKLLTAPQQNPQPVFAYPQGLYLAKVEYPYLSVPTLAIADNYSN